MVETALAAWRDGIAAIVKMPIVALVALVSVAVVIWAGDGLVPFALKRSLSLVSVQIFALAFMSAYGLVLTPIAIAVHRYVLLAERTTFGLAKPSHPRLLRFFLFTLVFQLLFYVPASLMTLATLGGISPIVLFIVQAVLVVIVLALVLHLLILFPAIAVDAEGANWSHAFQDTRSRAWRVFGVMGITSVPIIVAHGVVLWLRGPFDPIVHATLGLTLVRAAVAVISIAAYAAAASRLYLAFADRLGRPPDLRPLPV
jgi:hypothetical protein